MRRQFRLSISPTPHKSNLDHTISLKYGYIRSKQHLIQKLRSHPSPSDLPLRKKPILQRKKKTVSIVDFPNVLEQRLKLPCISVNNESPLRTSQSALIKDIWSFPPTKVETKNTARIPANVVATLSKRVMDSRGQVLEHYPRYASSMAHLERRHGQGAEKSARSPPVATTSKAKKKCRTEFEIEPWDGEEMGNTINNFNPQKK